MENKKKLDVSENKDPKVQSVLELAMILLAQNGIEPIIIIGRLKDGSTIDMSNSQICGKCIADRLEKVAGVYHDQNPMHRNNHLLN